LLIYFSNLGKREERKKKKKGKEKKLVIVLVIETIVTVIVIKIETKKRENHLQLTEKKETRIKKEMATEKIDHVQETENIVENLILGLDQETGIEEIKKRKLKKKLWLKKLLKKPVIKFI
jgi:hypothetical protein